MTLAPAPDEPARRTLWREIAAEIEADIAGNRLKPGDRLPTEQDLVARFGVNRHTVRRAIAELSELGVLRAEQGRGTFVQSGRIDYQITRRTRFSATMRAQDRGTAGSLLAAGEERADQRIAAALHIPPGAPLLTLEILRSADGFPVAIGRHLFAKTRFPGIVAAFQETSSVTEALAACGIHDYVRGRTEVSSVLPTPEEARLLQAPRTRPLLVTEAVNLDLDGNPVEFSTARFPADRVRLVFEP